MIIGDKAGDGVAEGDGGRGVLGEVAGEEGEVAGFECLPQVERFSEGAAFGRWGESDVWKGRELTAEGVGEED